MQQYEQVLATWTPKRTDDLSCGPEWIGKRDVFTASWIVEEGDYAGEWAMVTMSAWPFGWIPFSDLSDVEPVPSSYDPDEAAPFTA